VRDPDVRFLGVKRTSTHLSAMGELSTAGGLLLDADEAPVQLCGGRERGCQGLSTVLQKRCIRRGSA
jgi:hypothetical protein